MVIDHVNIILKIGGNGYVLAVFKLPLYAIIHAKNILQLLRIDYFFGAYFSEIRYNFQDIKSLIFVNPRSTRVKFN